MFIIDTSVMFTHHTFFNLFGHYQTNKNRLKKVKNDETEVWSSDNSIACY